MAQPANDTYHGIRYLTPDEVTFYHNDLGQLCLRLADGSDSQEVLVFRTLPISDPHRYISIRVGATASEQREIGILRDLKALPADQRRLLTEELDRRYFIHIITKVRSIREELGFLYWDCETDKGRREFAVPRWNQGKVIETHTGGRVVTDVDGNRYEIPDLAALDAESRARFLRYIYW